MGAPKYLDFADFVSLELWSAVVVDESDASRQLQRRNANELWVRASGLQGTTAQYIYFWGIKKKKRCIENDGENIL